MNGRALAVLSSLAIALLAAPVANADTTVPAGFDLFETDPEQTVFTFQDKTTIPPNFFDEGSKPFTGDVSFGGDPIGKFQGTDVGNADTIVARPAGGSTGPNGSAGQEFDIELRVLSLVGMAPIAVNTDQGVQLWDVGAVASPSRPSAGAMRAADTTPGGGVFDSRLVVYPKFTFTRLSDGATKVLDVGALPDGQRPDTPLAADLQPWRAGCVAPALVLPGVNDGFCPGQTPNGDLTVVVEQAPQAKHAVRPARRRLEHFGCYSAPSPRTFKSRTVKLSDQFGDRDAKVLKGLTICNPTRKNKELAVVNKRDHLRCYATDRGTPVNKTVLLRNQFGAFGAQVLEPNTLCLPSTKRIVRGKVPPRPAQRFLIDHYQCYRIRPTGDFPSRSLALSDQFGSRKVKIAQPSALCVPARKNKTEVRSPVDHLVCYAALPARKVVKRLRIDNQFGTELTKTRKSGQLCVPSIKIPG